LWLLNITKLRGPAKWNWCYLYVILDIFSRYVVGRMVASRESAAFAELLIRQTCAKKGIGRDQLTIHADRGSSMPSPARSAAACSTPHTPPTQNGSCESRPSHRSCPAVRGSTNQTTPRRPLSRYRSTVPHSG
jgi:transposase InsO family protein